MKHNLPGNVSNRIAQKIQGKTKKNLVSHRELWHYLKNKYLLTKEILEQKIRLTLLEEVHYSKDRTK